MLSDVYDLFQTKAELKGLDFSVVKTLSDDNAIIESDSEKLFAILSKLVNNAIKFTNKGKVSFGYQYKDYSFEFMIKDTGVGIADDRKSIIFDRFIQAELSHSRSFEGSGLGLSITKAYVEMLEDPFL